MADTNKPSQLSLLNEWVNRGNKDSKFYTPSSTESNEALTNAFNFHNRETIEEPEDNEEIMADTASLSFERARKALAENTATSVTSTQTKYNLDDLETDDEFQTVASRFLTSLGEGEDIFEYLRDSDYRVSSALYRGYQSGKWTDEQKADYGYLRSAFDNADVGGTANKLKATADGIVDFITDPIHILSLALTPVTGGVAALAGGAIAKLAGTSLATRIAQSKLLKTGIKKFSQATRRPEREDYPKGKKGDVAFIKALSASETRRQGTNYGITEGIVQGVGSSIGNQNIEVNANLRDSFSSAEVGLAGLIGGTAGGVLGLGGAAAISGVKNSKILKRVLERTKNREQEPKASNAADRKKENEEWEIVDRVLGSVGVVGEKAESSLSYLKDKFLRLTGKATSPLLKFAEDSEVLQDFLKRIRYDAFKDFSGKTFEKISKSFGLALGERTANYRAQLSGIFANLERTGWTNHLTAKQNEQLSFLLNDTDLLSKIKLIPVKDADGKVISYKIKVAGKMNEADVMDLLNAKWKKSNAIDIEATQKKTLQKVFGEKNVDRVSTEINIETIIAAKRLQKLSDDVFKDARILKDVNGKPLVEKNLDGSPKLNKSGKPIAISLLEESQKTRNFFPRFWNLQAIKDRKSALIKLLKDSSHSDINDNFLEAKYLDKETLEQEGVKKVVSGVELSGYKQDQYYFREYFDNLNAKYKLKGKQKIDSFKKAAKYFDKEGEFASDELIDQAAKQLKSEQLVQDILDQEFPGLSFVDYQNPKPLKHQRSRAFGLLADQDLIDAGFIENNVEQVWTNYFDNMAGAIERERYLGSTLSKFESRFISPLERELLDKGYDQEYINNIAKQMRDIYEVTTGTRKQKDFLQKAGSESFKPVQNFLKLTQQLAHLPLATISSLTEPLIILSKVGIEDTPAVINAFASAAGKQMKKSFSRFFTRFDGALKKAGVHNRSVKTFKDLTDDEWAEAYTWSIATQYSAQERLSAMFAGSVSGKKTARASEMFFSFTLLSPWTQAVQFGAFKTGKSVIQRLTKQLADGNLSAADKAYNIEKLWQIGIDPKKAVKNYNKMSVDGVLDENQWTKSAFYQNDVMSSSNLFAREIILNPSASEANKPLWFNSPVGQLVMQFASYPTVFNNTIMKGMIGEVARDPIRNAPKVVGATALMTGGAILTNAFRSEGRSLEESDERIAADAISRWGGFGPLDYGYRYVKGLEYGGMTAGSTLKAPFGPLVADVIDSIQYRHSPLQIAVQNTPFYSALSKEKRDAMKDWARGSKKSDTKKITPIQLATASYAKGGRVDVPNAVEEPEERKMRGLPLTYSDMAGPSVQDNEDRRGFAEGGEAETSEDNNYAVSVLTQHDDYGYFLEDQDTLEIYTADEMPKETSKESYFVALEIPNYHEINKKVEDSLGMDVSKSSVNLKGNSKVEGKVKVINTLEVDNPTSESIYNKLKELRTMPEDVSILKDMKFELEARDDVIKNSKILEKSKGVVVKDTLFNLGYDSISYNDGKNVVLLKANQFIPTKVEKNSIRKKVYGGGLMRTLNRRNFKEGSEVLGGERSIFRKLYNKIPTNIRLMVEFMAGKEDPITGKDFTPDNLKYILGEIKKQDLLNINNEKDLNEQLSYARATYKLNKKSDQYTDKEREKGGYLYTTLEDIAVEIKELEKNIKTYSDTEGKFTIGSSTSALKGKIKGLPSAVDYENEKGFLDSLLKSFTSEGYVTDTALGRYNVRKNKDGKTVTLTDTYNFPGQDPENKTVQLSFNEFLKKAYKSDNLREFGNLLADTYFRDSPQRNVEFTLPYVNPEKIGYGTDNSKKPYVLGGLATVLRKRQQYNEGGEALTFNQEYHLETIRQKTAMRNSEGQTVTVAVNGFEQDGMIYNLPTYDRRGSTIRKPLEFFKEDIKAGRIQGYKADKETYSEDKNNMHLHPANVAANKEHKMMEDRTPKDAITFGAIKIASIKSTQPTIEEVTAENKRRDDLNIEYGLAPARGADLSNFFSVLVERKKRNMKNNRVNNKSVKVFDDPLKTLPVKRLSKKTNIPISRRKWAPPTLESLGVAEPIMKGFNSVEESNQAYIDEVLSKTPYLDSEGNVSRDWQIWYERDD